MPMTVYSHTYTYLKTCVPLQLRGLCVCVVQEMCQKQFTIPGRSAFGPGLFETMGIEM